VGIDRSDYIKGIPHKLYAMERFFEENSDWAGKVVLIQIAVPSRTDVKEYQRLARETHEIVGRINGRFGSLASVPIHYLDQSIPFPRMCALYRVADVCINTSLRDGMNLVSYEYVACQQGKSGVLILSEFAGACQSLGAGCIRINPWDVKEVASAIREALTMSEDERQVYHSYSSQYVLEHSAQNWADSFVTALDRCVVPDIVEIIPPKLNFDLVCDNFVKTEYVSYSFNLQSEYVSSREHRLIILGLVGTLTQSRKEGVAFDLYTKFAKISPELTKAIQTITRDPHSSVLIVTSRNQENCERTCCHVGAYVAAENGYFLQDPTTDEWIVFFPFCR
jgi:trehalose 6-phosphate synthase/phosphatase